ncbi:outer membrane beta-barrel protein [Fulvivirga lutimaris]|uniref:outer membrane beta-barrel protein n=1 Tax=Fulvivirga lutimaris TaxID=1819566 RepID=UPI0012BC7BA6|nr:outer membrane beta-barrel protein [Fulvivirga lutimaris]MTI40154.1 hypothetical protein [Fulvivirga lutimaris]
MKKTLLLMVFVAIGMTANAQEFKPFKVGLGFGYAIPSDGGGGIAIYLEPGYRITDAILLNLRIESAAMAKVVGTQEAKVAASASYTVNGQYYFNNNDFRPFAGLGLGLFANANVEVSGQAGSASAGTVIGFYPRLGFDYKHFNFIFDYNLIPATDEVEVNGSTVELTENIKNSYMSIKIGVSIGGGRN